jgi:ATP-dependent RNA helicase RhlE
MKFDSLPINPSLVEALSYMNITEMSPIQEQSLPFSIDGEDVVACAQTGTGKTVAFLVPILNAISNAKSKSNKVKAMIIAPTTELAVQIDKQIDALGYFLDVSSLAIYGGGDAKGFTQEKTAIKQGVDIIVGTPGKLITHLNLGYLDLSEVEFFVLDEADRMLDMGFREDIFKVYTKIPDSSQSLLFTATMPSRLKDFIDKVAKGAKEIKISVSKTAKGVEQIAVLAHDEQKAAILEQKLRAEKFNSVIVFTGSKKLADQLGRRFKKLPMESAVFHSGLEQTERERIMLKFRSGDIKLIIATDILSRGIDVDNIEMVVNYDVPKDPEDYVHRVGRTARANKTGKALTFINSMDVSRFKRIEKLIELEIVKETPSKDLGEGPSYSSKPNNSKGYKAAPKKSNGPKKIYSPNPRPKKD